MRAKTILLIAVALFAPAAGATTEGTPPSAEDVLQRCAQTYKSMKSYYEQSLISVRTGSGDEARGRKGRVFVVFERGGELRVGIESTEKMAVTLEEGTLRVFAGSFEDVETLQEQSPSDVYDLIAQNGFPLFTLEAAISDDPYKVLTEGVKRIEGPEVVEFGGRKTRRVSLHNADGGVTRCYFDLEQSNLVAAVYEGTTNAGGAKVPMTISIVTEDVRIDEAAPADRLLAAAIPGLTPQGRISANAGRQRGGRGYAAEGFKWYLAPEFALRDLRGNEVVLSEQRGKVVLLDFWAIYCPPCRASLPALIKMSNDLKESPFAYYAITSSDTKTAIKIFSRGNKLDIPALLARGKTTSQQYAIQAIPTLFILDKEGFIRFVQVGWGGPQEVRQAVGSLLEEEYP